MIGRFDTDASALARRIDAHSRFGSQDLNGWILSHLDIRPGQVVLDLGCGLGKQTLPIARAVGPQGTVVAVDASSEAIEHLESEVAGLEDGAKVRTVRGSFDELSTFDLPRFDRVVGSYSLYYTDDAGALMRSIADLLVPDGVLFFCGPARGNNGELLALLRDLGHGPTETSRAARFMEDEAPDLARALFDQVTLSDFDNPLKFESAEAVHEYWASHNLFDPALDRAFRSAIGEHFLAGRPFVTTKRARGIRAAGPRGDD